MGQLGKRVLSQIQAGKSLWARRLLGDCTHLGAGKVNYSLTAQYVNTRKQRRCQQSICSQSRGWVCPTVQHVAGLAAGQRLSPAAGSWHGRILPLPGLWGFSSIARPGRLAPCEGAEGDQTPASFTPS